MESPICSILSAAKWLVNERLWLILITSMGAGLKWSFQARLLSLQAGLV